MKKLITLNNGLAAVGIFSLLLMSCEDKINPALEYADPVLVVDAWINDRPEPQVISLTMTQPYFENVLPSGLSGAIVTVSDDHGNTYTFTEDDKKSGSYVWKPATGEIFGTVGYHYTLHVDLNGEKYEAVSRMGRVPTIDSISFDKDKRTGTSDIIVRGEFWATDPQGAGDTYWIRTYKNGVRLDKPSEIVVAYDAGFSAGGLTDGVMFITPIRRGVNARDKDAAGKALSPIVAGDSIHVQIHSVSLAAFNFLNQVKIQTDRPGGFQELFSKPLSNVSTNVVNLNPNGKAAVGFFNVSSVSVFGKRYTP